MSNLANNNTVRRRKTTTTKSKSKHTSTSTNSASNNTNTTPTIIPTATAIVTAVNSITNVGSHNPSSTIVAPAAMPNERLQRYSLSDILVGMMRRTIIKQSNNDDNASSPTFVLRNPNPTLCNGSITCCRDVNCSLNLLNGQLSNIMQQQQQQQPPHQQQQTQYQQEQQQTQHQQEQQQQPQNVQCLSISSNASKSPSSSHSLNSRRSRSSTATSCKQNSTDIKTLTSEQHFLRNDTPITDGSGDVEMEKFHPSFNELTTPDLSLTSVERIFTLNLQLDMCTWLLFALAICTRFYKLTMPRHVVFDEIHYGKYISLYMKNIFFFDQHPPLGKQLIAAVTHMASNYNGNYTFPYIGAEYSENVPIFWLRFVPALCGSALAPIVYKLLLAARLSAWFALLGGLLIIFENALLTQSRFILMESMLLFFATCGLYYMIRFQNCRFGSIAWLLFGFSAASCFTFAASVKYAGFLTYLLTAYLSWRHFWDQLYDATLSNLYITLETICRTLLFTVVPIALYVGIFYIHLQTLYRAGPHDSAMTSAFQASLKGGLASITRGQPIKVVHGSQITLRHTHGRTCWLHSHAHVYPVRYPDKRGSSHQQQVTCYSFKDVNNWWIVKRPDREDLVVGDVLDVIRHGDIIQLVHGITSRGLNSHDVAAPMTPDCQEVSCYIDYEIGMVGELLWRVEILNRDRDDAIWHAIKSEVRLIHHTTGAALRISGRHLPEWGFNQHEVVADRVVDSRDAIWNVEEHRYTNTQNQRERARQLLKAEMIPTKRTKLNFIEKFFELQSKMFWYTKRIDDHMYSSSPFEWPLLDRGIAYWVNPNTNSQIHLLGNILIWYSGTIGLLFYIILNIFYILRRRRLHFDLPESEWKRFRNIGDLFLISYLIHYLPYFLVERTLFLHHYLPAYIYKILLLCYVFEHIDYVLRLYYFRNCDTKRIWLIRLYRLIVLIWFISVVWIFIKFLPITYGLKKMSTKEITNLRWKDTWDFILPRDDYLKYLFI